MTLSVKLNAYDYLPGVERANFVVSAVIKAVRAPVIGPPFAAMENKVVLAAIMRGGVVDPSSLPDAYLNELARVGKQKGYSKVARSL